MAETYTDAPTVLKTISLVGRAPILKQITEIATTPSNRPNVIFLTAEGGYGKTRILQRAKDELQEHAGLKVAHELIDLYHLKNHTIHDFVGSIVDVLSYSNEGFRGYDQARRRLNRMRLSGADVNIGKQRDLMVEEFSDEMQTIAAEEHIVLFLDTAERILYSPFDSKTSVTESAEIWSWLLQQLPIWKNITVVVAGRSQIRHLKQETKPFDDVRITDIDVPAFTEEESLEYFDRLVSTMRIAKLREEAEQIAAMERHIRLQAHHESDGQPIMLALCVDLYLNIGQVPTANPQSVVQQLMQGSDVGETVRALGRLTKGATPELLSQVLDCSVLEAERRLQDVQNLSFVKLRPEDKRVFLHDEMYAYLRQYVYDGLQDEVDAVIAYNAVLDFYQVELERNQAELDELFRSIEFEGKEHVEISRLEEITMARRTLMVESLYYRLSRNPVEGFKYYYRFMREAVYSGDTLLDRELLLTLVEFWSERDPSNKLSEIDGLEKRVLLGIGYVRPITRAWAEHRYQDAVDLAGSQRQAIIDDSSGTYQTTLAVLDTWDAYARTYLSGAENVATAHSLLNGAIESMKTYLSELESEISREQTVHEGGLTKEFVDPKIELRLWRAKAVLAFAYRVRGYLSRTTGNSQKAIEDYRLSAPLWTEVGVLVELGFVKNDLGFALQEQLLWDDARDLVSDALSIRRRLGSRANVALSINTLGLIELAEGRYAEGREKAMIALALSRAIDFKRGQGLALVALCEASRRLAVTESIPSPEEKTSLLREARDLGLEAIEIFMAEEESSRLIDALVEVGCTCREWIQVMQGYPNRKDDPNRLYKEGQAYLNSAIELAAQKNSEFKSIDALVDLARLAYYMGDEEVEEQSIFLALAAIPDDYRLDLAFERPAILDVADKDEINTAYWPLLGKIFSLRGQQAFDEYIKSASRWQRDPKHPRLKEMAEDFMLCHEYFAFRDDDYRDLRRGTTQIHLNISGFGATENRNFAAYVVEAERKYKIKESELQRMLTRRGMWALATR